MIGQQEAKNLCDQVLRRCQADAAEVTLFTRDSALTRFANNIIHQNVAERDAELSVRYIIGKRSGIATTNRTDAAALDELVRRAKASAQASPEDPDYPGLPEPASYGSAESFDDPTAGFSPETRAAQVGVVCRLAAGQGLNASGAFSTGSGEMVISNTQGLFAYHLSSEADFQTVVMSSDSSGRAQGTAWKVADIPVEKLGKDAIQTAVRGRNPVKIEAGEYTVVLEHYVTDDILGSLNFYGMGARAVQEGRSWMNDRQGQQVMSPLVSIWDDGLDVNGKPQPFDFEGVPKQRVEIVSQGVVKGPVYDRYTGAKDGKSSTGHALPASYASFGPIATNLFFAAGGTSLDEMIRSTERGIYINRFWYTRLVHPRDCVVTGMTRDGVFMIENGALTFPVKNLRFTQSYVQALANLEAVGDRAHLIIGEFGGLAQNVPAMKINGFNFTGSTV